MGLFGKLFEKKICDICGGEIGLLGNRKLEDGNMCKDCAKLLSPFFDDRRNSTVAQIKEQLAYREANKAAVDAFRVTRTYGEDYTKLLVDETADKFMVTSADDLRAANPDVIAFADITGCELEIDDNYEELTHEDKDGNEVSYKPPRYRFDYDFYLKLRVRNPYFDEIRFQLNDEAVSTERQLRPGYTLNSYLNDKRVYDPENTSDYRRFKEMGEEIRTLLLQLGGTEETSAAPEAAAPEAAAPVIPAVIECPYCGAATKPGASGCCECCGAPLNG